jgi:hypothetical protein
MATIYKILGYTIWIVAGLFSLYGEWIFLVDTVGWVDPITFFIFSPLEIAIVPFILAFQGHFQLLIITFGGAALGYFFIAAAERLEQKSSPNKSSSATSHRKSQFAPNKNQFQKCNYQPGEEVITNIVGVTFEDRQKVINRLMVGDDVFLEREPNNPYDSNAIKVLTNRYTKDERDKLEGERINKYDQMIKSINDQTNQLSIIEMEILRRMLPSSQEQDDKIAEIDRMKSQLEKQLKELRKERIRAINSQFEKVQAGYINKELALLIAPFFDRWATDPVTIVTGKVIKLTGKDKPDHSYGAVIRFKIPDEYTLKSAINHEMSRYY